MIANVSWPMAWVCAPSAIVSGVAMRWIVPVRNDCWPSLPAAGSTP
jgi:hypothetical protein